MEIDGKEVLIPIHDDIFFNVNLKEGRADVNLPEGLLDIFIDSKDED